jgi:hypothetical protein
MDYSVSVDSHDDRGGRTGLSARHDLTHGTLH